MGVPSFFKWLCMRCPRILHDVVEGIPQEVLDEDEDYLNHTDLEVDNLYLDMNCIIHPCSHPDHLPIPKPLTEEDMFNNIFKYLDKLIRIVKPRKLVYFAVDGVAPRAKMNQQRGRRFRAAQETVKLVEKKEILKQEWQQKGQDFPSELEEDFSKRFDSNVITPGTEFMHRMSKAVQYYITERMNSDPLFKNLKCIFSDAYIPGEGEHKLLDFVRQQRALPDYDPNTKHCLYGADADLIMLGLSTHEPYFYILRETIMTKAEMKDMTGDRNQSKEMEGEFNEKAKKEIPINFQFVKLHVFREYLDYEFKYLNTPFQYDLEKVIDDFVFMCFFVGNDFLPHLPCLSIREGGIDCLMYLYKRILPFMGGNLTENGTLNLMRVEILMRELGQIEEELLRSAQRNEENRKNREKNRGGRGGRGGRDGGDDRRVHNDNRRGRSNNYERLDSSEGNNNYRDGSRDNRDHSRDNRYDRGGDRNDYNRDRDGRYNRDGRDNRYDRGDSRDYRDNNRNYRDYNRGDNRDYNRGDSRDYRDNRDSRDNRYDRNDRNRDRGEAHYGEDRGGNNNQDERGNRNMKNRSAAEALRDQIAGSVEDPNNQQVNKMNEAAGGANNQGGEKKAAGVSLADWSRDIEEEEEPTNTEEVLEKPVETPVENQTVQQPVIEETPKEKEDQSVDEKKSVEGSVAPTEVTLGFKEDEDKIVKDIEEKLTSEGEEKLSKDGDTKVAEEAQPRDKFNEELQKLMRDPPINPEDNEPNPPGPYTYKQQYYFQKFKVTPEELPEFKKLIQKAYCEALCWIFAYYYKGCVSWSWYYPFNYTPFASDMVNLDRTQIQFEKGEPFKPVAQLLAVLPPYSNKAVPLCFRHLMLEDDSEICDFYPKDFVVDTKGKRFAWMGEVILPFIDEDRLQIAISKYSDKMTPSEMRRNIMGQDVIYMRVDNELMNEIKEHNPTTDFLNAGVRTYLDYGKTQIAGFFTGRAQKFELGKFYAKPFPSDSVMNIDKNEVCTLTYENPLPKPHVSSILQGATMPDKLMTDAIFEQVDRRVYGGSRTIRMVERALGVQSNGGHVQNRAGYLNSGLGETLRTSYGINQGQAHLNNFNSFFNNNRAVEAMPTQFKRWHIQPQYQGQQQQQQQGGQQYYPPQANPQAGHLNMPPPGAQGNPNMPPMNPLNPMNQVSYNPLGGNFPFNPAHQQGQGPQGPQGPQGYMPQQQPGYQGHQNRFQNPPMNQQGNVYDPLQKRDRPYQQRSPDERYGDQPRKQQHYNN